MFLILACLLLMNRALTLPVIGPSPKSRLDQKLWWEVCKWGSARHRSSSDIVSEVYSSPTGELFHRKLPYHPSLRYTKNGLIKFKNHNRCTMRKDNWRTFLKNNGRFFIRQTDLFPIFHSPCCCNFQFRQRVQATSHRFYRVDPDSLWLHQHARLRSDPKQRYPKTVRLCYHSKPAGTWLCPISQDTVNWNCAELLPRVSENGTNWLQNTDLQAPGAGFKSIASRDIINLPWTSFPI